MPSFLGSLFGGGGGGDAPAPPAAPQAPAPMPLPDDAAGLAARRKKIAAVEARSGRLSTILSEAAGNTAGGASEKLGG